MLKILADAIGSPIELIPTILFYYWYITIPVIALIVVGIVLVRRAIRKNSK